MENAIVETPVRLIRAEKLAGEYELLGTSILAHLLAIHRGGVVSDTHRNLLNELDTELDEVLADIRQNLGKGKPQERICVFPVLLGKPGDAALDPCSSSEAQA
jgi:hypothetical protein